jgi:formate dehydrogenase
MVFARSLSRQLGRSSTLLSAAGSSRPAFRPTPLAGAFLGARTLTASASLQGKVLMVLYDGGQHAKDQPGLLGTTENELGLRKWLESEGHTLVTTSDKEGENSTFDKELVDAEVIITTPYVSYLALELKV